jgi:hypothetical protein
LMQDRISQVEEASCTARPDHTSSQTRPFGDVGSISGCPKARTAERFMKYAVDR